VADVDIPGLNDRARSLQLYMPISPVTGRANFVFRSTRPVFKLDSVIRAIVRDAAPGATVGNPIIADELLSGARQTQHSLLQVIGAFALVALCLAAIGLHAVIAFSVGQRTREIGMRGARGRPGRRRSAHTAPGTIPLALGRCGRRRRRAPY